MHLTATSDDRIAHVLYYLRQPVSADVGVCIGKNSSRSPMLTEHVQNLLNVASLLRTGVEFSVGVGTCPTLTKAVVALFVHLLRTSYIGHVFFSFVHILSPFQHDGAEAQFNQSEGSKESAWACTHDDDLPTVAHIGIVHMLIFVIGRQFVHIDTHLQVHIDGTLTGINTSLQYADSHDLVHPQTVLVGQ